MDHARTRASQASWIMTAMVLCGIVWFMRHSIAAMVDIWLNSRSFNHCFLIAPASAVLIWRRRRELSRTPARASVAGILLFGGCAAAWGIGALAHLATLQNVAAVAMVPAALWAVLGSAIVREIAFPLAYLFFMVPFGEFLVPWLMELTAALTVSAARLSGVPVYQDGLFFVIPNGSFKIVEACSGLRMLIASVAIAVLFAHLAFTRWQRRVLFVVAMVVVSIIANSVRTYTVVMMGHYLGMDATVGHQTLGYVVFGVTILIMLTVGSRFAEPGRPPAEAPAVLPGGHLLASAIAGVVVTAIAIATPRLVAGLELRKAQLTVPLVPVLPEARGDWTGPRAARGDWKPEFVGYDAAVSGSYRRGSRVVDAHMLSYSHQTQGQEIINQMNRVFDPREWTRLRYDVGGTTRVGAGEIRYLELELRGSQARRLVRYWYIVDGRPRHRAAEVKLRELKNSVLGRPTPATLVSIGTTVSDDVAAARQLLDAFIVDVYAGSRSLD